MSAAQARSARPSGPGLRPESEWEYISYPGGVYSALRVPVVELTVGEEPAVIVLFTHDCGLAARVAWPLWCAEQGGLLTRPIRHWWRREPVDPATVERDGYEHMWWPARPGTPGAIPLVEFPFPSESPWCDERGRIGVERGAARAPTSGSGVYIDKMSEATADRPGLPTLSGFADI